MRGDPEDHRRAILRQVAFMMRYAHQPAGELLRMRASFMNELAGAIDEIMADERGRFDALFTGGG